MGVRFAPIPRRWVFSGGVEDDESLTLNIMIQLDEDAVKRYEVRVPITVERNELVVGRAEVTEL